MTNEEAIKEIQKWLDGCPFADTKEAFNLAIKALETGEVYMTGEDYNLYMEGYKDGKRDFAPKQGKPVIKCKDCKHQKKYWHEDKRMKEKGYWIYGCDLIDDSFVGTPVWGEDNQFCSSAEQKGGAE